MITVECWQSCTVFSDWVLFKTFSSPTLFSVVRQIWIFPASHWDSLHGRGVKSLEIISASLPKHFGPSLFCCSSKVLPILMCRIREAENLWKLCTATLPSTHIYRMALLVGFLRTKTFFLLHKEFEMRGSPSVHNKVGYSEISKPFVNWNDLSLVSYCPLAMGVAGCSKFTYTTTFWKKKKKRLWEGKPSPKGL